MTRSLDLPVDVAAPPFRMYYVDDSGSVDSGYIVFSWIECSAGEWSAGLRAWLDFRRDLFAKYAVPPAYEIHTAQFAGGRGHPSTDSAWNRSKRGRREALELALAAIGAAAPLRVGSVYRVTGATGRQYAAERADVYARLVRHLDDQLIASGGYGMIFMDGDGTDPSYSRAHRDLSLRSRRLIEDPLFQGSDRSQWIQMADIAAWSSYQGLRRGSNAKYAWRWYETHLLASDVNGGPLQL